MVIFSHSCVFVVNNYQKNISVKTRILKLYLKVSIDAIKYLINGISNITSPQMKLILRPIQLIESIGFPLLFDQRKTFTYLR